MNSIRLIENGLFKKGDKVEYNNKEGVIINCYYISEENKGYQSYDILLNNGKILNTGDSSLYGELKLHK
jgi:signal peptidase I